MSAPLVSIVIPSWNHAETLGSCLASIEKQTYRSIEIIVVDDGSTDGTEVQFGARTFSVPYHFVRLVENRGAAAARNEGARHATGEFILFVDADEVLAPLAIEKMVSALSDHPEAAFAYSSFRFGFKLFPALPFDAEKLRQMPFIHTTSLLRCALFPGFDESLKKFQDWDLWLTIVERGGKGIVIPEELFQISIRDEGMSNWMPSFVHHMPWPIFGWMPKEIAKYRHWEKIVKEKHHIA